jgi:hypothetical protein
VAGPESIAATAAAMPELAAVRQYLAAARASEVSTAMIMAQCRPGVGFGV